MARYKLLSAVAGLHQFKLVRTKPPKDYLKLRKALYDAEIQIDTDDVKTGNQYGESLITEGRFNNYNPSKGQRRSYDKHI